MDTKTALKLMKKRGVVAVGEGYKVTEGKQTKELCHVFSVDTKKPIFKLSKKDLIPNIIDGIPTDVIQTGVIFAQQAPTGRFRPAPGGVSCGHYSITAGTLGCWVRNKDDKYVLLSNNHVLSASNDANTGDNIYQPGSYDGGSYTDTIARLKDFVEIDFGGSDGDSCPFASATAGAINFLAKIIGSKWRLNADKMASPNLVDAAIAEPIEESVVKDEIYKIGKIAGLKEGQLGLDIQKYGRTTLLTKGTITQVNAVVQVQYGQNKTAVFEDQLVAGAMSAGGDSGSAVLDMNNNLVGLLYAGSDTTTIINRIQNVFNLLNLSL